MSILDRIKLQKISTIIISAVVLLEVFYLLIINSISIVYAGEIIIPAGVKPIYGVYAASDDGIADGWQTDILNGTLTAINLTNKSPIYQGTNSISYTISLAGDELTFEAPEPFDTNEFEYLTFYARSSLPGLQMGVKLLDQSGNRFSANDNGALIESFGGALTANTWNVYNIPISAFNAPSTVIKGLVLKNLTGASQDVNNPLTLYIDEMNFSFDRGEDIPVASTPAQTQRPTQEPTPVLPYYPEINPWVWIIPGILVALAIIFQ